MADKTDKKEKIELDIKEKVEEPTESDIKALQSFNEYLQKSDKKLTSLEKEIKGVVEKLDSFEFDTEEELTKPEPKAEQKSDKKGLFIIFAILGILVAWTFKDKLKNGIQ